MESSGNFSENNDGGIRLAVVGGGERCLSLLQMLEIGALTELGMEIVGVADAAERSPGLRYAREKGLLTTNDFHELFGIPGLEMIINLTRDRDFGVDLENSAPDGVTVLPYRASRLFQEIIRNVLQTGKQIHAQADQIMRAQSFALAMSRATIVGVMILDTNYRIVWINEAALKAAGLRREEAIGRYCFQVSHQRISPCSSPETPCPMIETLKTGLAEQAIHEHKHKSGRTTYCDVSTYPLFNSDGNVGEVVEVIRDMTDDLNEKLERRTRDLKNDLARLVQEDKLIALGKMVASAAHEINNPIASIINFSKFIKVALKEGATSPAQLEQYDRYLELTLKEARRCGDIVGNLLSFSRQRPVEPKVIDLCQIVEQIIDLTTHKMELSNIRLNCRWERRPLEAPGDSTQIQQCLLNLIFNAMEAMPEGGRLMVRGGLDERKEKTWVEVTDSGIGISEENLKFIFEPFFTTKEESHGVGLGLSMVYGIIREHRGEISVESREGRGTTFRIQLPAALAGRPEGKNNA